MDDLPWKERLKVFEKYPLIASSADISKMAADLNEKGSSPFCVMCKEKDCLISHDATCAMIRKYLKVAQNHRAKNGK